MIPRAQLVKPPQQQRSRDALERVLRSGLNVLQEDGFEGFTVHKVSRRANVSIGSIYARIPSREALILAIYEWAMAWTDESDLQFERDAQLHPAEPRELVETIVSDFARLHLVHASEWRVFVRQAPLHPEIFARGQEKTHDLKARFEQALLTSHRAFRHEDPQRAVTVVFSLVFATITRRISHGAEFDGSSAITDDDLVRELGIVAADYLL
jgi:AcrR family transcriptional regulator